LGLTEAVAEETEGYRGVSSARARLLGDPADPELVLTVALEETADFAALRQRIETGGPHPRRLCGRQPIAAHPAGSDRHHETFHPGRLNRGSRDHRYKKETPTMSARDKAKKRRRERNRQN
jgi:hypothetical protein